MQNKRVFPSPGSSGRDGICAAPWTIACGGSGATIPRALTDYIKAREGYDYSHHGKAGNPTTDFVPDEVVDRFCLLGPAEQHLERLQELREIGADNFSVYLMHDAQDATLDAYATRVVGAV